MPRAHVEKHFEASDTVRDVVIGMSDGLTVPFALAAGLSGTVHSTQIVVIAGLAEIAAGSIAMGLGGYLAARTDRDHYLSEREREMRETVELPEKETEEVADVFRGYGMSEADLTPVVQRNLFRPEAVGGFHDALRVRFRRARPQARAQQRGDHRHILRSGRPGAAGAVHSDGELYRALTLSVGVTLVALFIFGYVKGKLTGISPLRGGLQTVIIGGLASAAAFGLAKAISG